MQNLNGSFLLNALTAFALGIHSESDDFHNALNEVRDWYDLILSLYRQLYLYVGKHEWNHDLSPGSHFTGVMVADKKLSWSSGFLLLKFTEITCSPSL